MRSMTDEGSFEHCSVCDETHLRLTPRGSATPHPALRATFSRKGRRVLSSALGRLGQRPFRLLDDRGERRRLGNSEVG
jgi:hypothetical protein